MTTRFWYLCLLLPTVVAISPQCQSYLIGVARTNSQFQVCALIRARPFSVCTNCYQDYSSAFNTFVELEDGRGPVQKNCSEDLISGDRISVINRDFKHLKSTWEDANCASCLVTSKDKDVVSFEIAETTKEFKRLSDDVNRCIDIQLQNKSRICDACSDHFRNLSSFYEDLSVKFSGKMCMDILDTMNQTRVEWSTFGCAKIYTLGDNFLVWIFTTILAALTAMFYVGVRFSQPPMDEGIIEGKTLRHRMSRMGLMGALSASANSDSLEVEGLNSDPHREFVHVCHVQE